ncbi:hypothetical protein NLI96_g8573 [Meripilus lineatus]|uniref:Glycoside hydrolase family 76 protein n=1 Tax=Meripilus lineatus TaxID=2056292 RepID=A0AAD5UXC7_9APHY|nr:hypothetical protein NLI96_g8573 [Physisporinus lineatus]
MPASNWGLAAMYGYHAYQDQQLLQVAISNWNNTYQYFITPQDAASGTHPERNVSFPSQCNGGTTAGGVFWHVDLHSDAGVNGETVASFMALTAYLYEATNDTKYYDAATLTATFIETQLYDKTVVTDGIGLVTCYPDRLTLTYNSGYFIEALAIYAKVTNSVDWTSFLHKLVATAIKFPSWTGDNGVITEVPPGPTDADTNSIRHTLKAIFIRGLYVAWSRADPTSEMAKLIRAYIMVQFNSIMNVATVPGANQFSPTWFGPPAGRLLPWGQVAALDVLNAALGLALHPAPEASATPTGIVDSTIVPEPTSPITRQERKQHNVPLIAGLTSVGGVIICLLVVIVVVRRLRGPRQKAQDSRETSGEDAIDHLGIPGLEPFAITASRRRQPTERQEKSESDIIPEKTPEQGTSSSSTATRSRDGFQEQSDLNYDDTLVNVGGSESGATDGPSTIPHLLERLNRAMAMLPPGGVSAASDVEDPPEYAAT